MQVKSIAECSKGEHSAILSTFIKLQFVIMIFVLSKFEWPLKTGFTVSVYHMMLLLFNGQCHVINNVMTTLYILLSAGTSNVMVMSVTTIHIFIEINNL